MNSSLIEKMKTYALKENVPIMQIETINYINELIDRNKIETILEIGTAIAYSTINFAMNKSVLSVHSIERDNERYSLAVENVKKSKLDNIKLINDDALNIDINDLYDLIIIDAAKSQNIKFFEKYKNNLNSNGIIVIDNMNFHGLVHSKEKIESRNVRALVRKLEMFWTYIDEQEDYEIEHLDIGDGIVVCKKKII